MNYQMDKEKKYWLDEPQNVDKICWALYAVSAFLVLGDLFYHKHSHFPIEDWFGFYGFYGFVACVSLVLAAKVLRKIIGRKEDYYD